MFRKLILITTAGLTVACDSAPDSSAEAAGALREQLRSRSMAFMGQDIAALQSSSAAVALSEELFAVNCASCHGVDGRGEQGVTDLVDGVFNFGASEDAIRATTTHGRIGVMPAMGRQFGEMDLGQLVAYVQSLSSNEPRSKSAERGMYLYADHCVICHADNGVGNSELGAPNLADDYWLHGGSMMDIRLAITRGVQGQCPANAETLSNTEIDLLTAFVLSRATDKQLPGWKLSSYQEKDIRSAEMSLAVSE